jgi:hypothetical protein
MITVRSVPTSSQTTTGSAVRSSVSLASLTQYYGNDERDERRRFFGSTTLRVEQKTE